MNVKQCCAILAVSLVGFSAFAMERGTYIKSQGDTSKDILVVNSGKQITLEETRQVGGPGGISNDETVPYETSCRYRIVAEIVSEDSKSLSYRVRSINLAKRTLVYSGRDQAANDLNCNTYTNIFDGKAKTENVQFTLEKEGFEKQP